MKKIFLAVALVLVTASFSCAATSDDIYVRQDVFDAKMEAFLNRMLVEFENVRGDIKALSSRIDNVESKLTTRIDNVESKLTTRIDNVESNLSSRIDSVHRELSSRIDSVESSLSSRIDVLQTVVYWGLGILSLLITSFVLAPVVGAVVQKMKSPSIGIEDVKRLIEENNAKLLRSLQNSRVQ